MRKIEDVENIEEKIGIEILFGEGTYDIFTYFKDFPSTNVSLMVDTKRHKYYVIQSDNDLSSKIGVDYLTKFLRENIIDKIAEYSDKESLTYRSNSNARNMLCGMTTLNDSDVLKNLVRLYSEDAMSYTENEIINECLSDIKAYHKGSLSETYMFR